MDACRFGKQFSALCAKNFKLAKRAWRSTLIRLFASFLFMLLVFFIDLVLRRDNERTSAFKTLRTPEPEAVGPIPSCADDRFIASTSNCYDFAYTPRGHPTADALAARIALSNPGRAIPSDKVHAWDDRDAADDWMLANPQLVPAVVHFDFEDGAAGYVGYTLQVNTTVVYFKGDFRDVNMYAQVPLQVAVQREVTNMMLENEGLPGLEAYDVAFSEFAHPSLFSFSLVSGLLGPFLFAANMFGFVLQLSLVVGERENGLRQALTTAGLLESAYWASWVAYELVMTFCSSMLMTVFGYVFQFDMWKKNSFALLFFTFLMFQLSLSGMGFALSTLIRRSSSAVNLGFAIYIVGWVFQLVTIFGFPYTPDTWFKHNDPASRFGSLLFSMMPFTLFIKGLTDLDRASSSDELPGLEWGERYSYCKNLDDDAPFQENPDVYVDRSCIMPIGKCMEVMLALYILYTVLGIYLDHVIPNESGQYRPVWFFLDPGFWVAGWGSSKRRQLHVGEAELAADAGQLAGSEDADVAAEKDTMKALLQTRLDGGASIPNQDSERIPKSPQSMMTSASRQSSLPMADEGNAIEVYGLKKVFTSLFQSQKNGFHAIKGSWFAIKRGQLFCLLGPNGAGKTTTINCLTGVLRPTGGDAICAGDSLLSPGGIDRIRAKIGVCTQFDMLWPVLTGEEHLMLYGHIKGIAACQVRSEAARLLQEVALEDAATVQAGSYSGGMKRRLSVAISLLGDPAIVFLDEPTTGMDPIARRHVWDCIETAKKGRAVVLTTHSMEEADVLGDRIAIMARGRLRCIGSNLRLKQRFGAGYQVSVSVQPERGDAVPPEEIERRAAGVRETFASVLGLEAPLDETNAYMLYVVPREKADALPELLRSLEARTEELGITDINLGLTSLEEVFLGIARQSELEAAQELHGKKAKKKPRVVKHTLPEGTVLSIAVGAETIVDVTTGINYNVTWVLDADGGLAIRDVVPMAAAAVGAGVAAAAPAGTEAPNMVEIEMPDGMRVLVARGVPGVRHHETGECFDLEWAPDATGALVVKKMTPAPAAAQ